MPTDPVLVAITTYAGNYETRLILRKVLRHFRWRNGAAVPLLVVSDGPILDAEVYRHADYVLCRRGPCGLQRGELDSLHLISAFARTRGYRYVLKSAGDVILNTPNWVDTVISLLVEKRRYILSTHWFGPSSWIVGTKFFAADVEFLNTVLPHGMDSEFLEDVFTRSIQRNAPVPEIAYLIDSTTGEADEVSNELALWQWEHAHRLYKFRNLDDPSSIYEGVMHRGLLYPALRIWRQLQRTARRLRRA